MAVLEVNGLNAFYGKTQALFDVSLSIPEKSLIAVIGPNGAGKSTLLRGVSRLVKTEGVIKFQGVDISNFKPSRASLLGIGHVPQDRGTFQNLSVEENLRMAAQRKHRSLYTVTKKIDEMFDMFPQLKSRSYIRGGLLSGGEQQMLAIARALLCEPQLLMMDEPSLGLAPKIAKDIFSLISMIRKTQNCSILLVDQNVNAAIGLADYVYILESGRIMDHGASSEMRGNKEIIKSYLGY